jgi:hypothetical protein
MTPDPTRILCRRCDRNVVPYEDICGGDRVKLCPHCHKRLGSAGTVKGLHSVGNPAAEVVRYRRVRTV